MALSPFKASATLAYRRWVRDAVFAFLAVAVVLVLIYRPIIFGLPIEEAGDFAANALQIDNAKSLAEILGNYSRWGFNHPGPAFFYIYALGEVIFYDRLGVVRSPHQAHLLAGIGCQSLFVGVGIATLCMLASFRLPLVLTGIFLIHLGLGDRSLSCIWPPSVLVGPSLALYPLAAAVSLGYIGMLPFLFLTAGFLVHGHVAQPLFVAPVAFFALLGLWIKGVSGLRKPSSIACLLLASLILAIFITPVALDIVSGTESNVARILAHAGKDEADTKSLSQALAYFAAFFVYSPHDEKWIAALTNKQFLLNSLRLWLPISCVFMSLAICARRELKIAPDTQRLMLFTLGGLLLSLVWGIRQDGEMYAFNSFYFYSLTFLALTPFIFTISRPMLVLPQGAVLVVAAVLLAIAVAVTPSSIESSNQGAQNVRQQVRQILKDAKSDHTIRLSFQHSDWPHAASVAIALKRLGWQYEVDTQWGFMFGRKIARSSTDSLAPRKWTVSGISDAEAASTGQTMNLLITPEHESATHDAQ